MPNKVNPKDLRTTVEVIVWDLLRYHMIWAGIIKEIKSDGVALIHSETFGTKLTNRDSWIKAKPSYLLKSFVLPEIGDEVEFFFCEGTPDKVRYMAANPDEYKSKNGGLTKDVLYEHNTASLLYNKTSSKFSLKSGSDTIEKSALGETLVNKLKEILDAITNITVTTAGIPSGTPNNSAAFISIKANIEDILSDNFEHN